MDLCHKIPSLHNPSVPTPCLNLKNKSHPVKSALARTLGVSVPKNSDRRDAFSHRKRKCPIPLWKSREKPFSQERFLGLLSFGIFPLQKQRKVHKIFNKAKKSLKNEFLYRFLEKTHNFAKKSLTLSQKSDRILYY